MKKNIKEICSKVDHTNLKKTATPEDISKLCNDAIKYNAASVCVQPCYVNMAAGIIKDSGPAICTVVGFPNGYNTKRVKAIETIDAIWNGATEIDMVINVAWLKIGEYDKIRTEIQILASLCHYRKAILKVIVETCLLTAEEIEKMVELCIDGGADYIKTSTGFDSAGAKVEDIQLMKKAINGRNLKIKASGGIRTLEDAAAMIEAGADRIGASALFEKLK